MNKLMSIKIIIAVLSICILSVSLGLYLTAASGEEEVMTDCEKYCDRFKEGFEVFACFHGCLSGAEIRK
jgi:hypothetical protein